MAFTTIQTEQTVQGNKRVIYGRYLNTAGSVGGTVVTGLDQLHFITFTPFGGAAALVPSLTAPPVGGNAVIVTSANQEGSWKAEGL
jgi:hypothetical protein